MAKTGCILVTVALTVLNALTASGQPDEDATNPETIEVTVLNRAGVPVDVLKQAQIEAARIYAPTRVMITWSDELPAETTVPRNVVLRITISIVPHAKLRDSTGPMGFAVKGGKLAYVFYARVGDFARIHRVLPGKLLGHVLAHELGHLLIPGRPHSVNGLMRSHWTRAAELSLLRTASFPLSFTPDEAELIRHRMARLIEQIHAGPSVLIPNP